MRTFRTIILLTGIIVAGLAMNTALAQTTHKHKIIKEEAKAHKEAKSKAKLNHNKDKQYKHELKAEIKSHKQLHKDHKYESKAVLKEGDLKRSQKQDMKAHKLKIKDVKE
jgi:hypothetical protein